MANFDPNVAQPVPEDPNSGKTYFRIVQDPERNWKPYRDMPMYDDNPELGTYQSTLYAPQPRAGDYLVREPDGSTYAVCPGHLERFDDVEFETMPSLDNLLATGTIVEVPEHIRKVDFALQDKMSSLNADIVAEDTILEELASEMSLRRFGFPTKIAREAKALYNELKPKFDAMCQEYSDLETELHEKVIKPLADLAKDRPKHIGLDQVISNAADRRQQQLGSRQNTQDRER